MDKNQIKTILQQAKPDHIEWIKQGHKLLKGVPQEQIRKPEGNCDCLFGKWYSKEGFKMVNIPQLHSAEALHKEIHNLYTALYYITFDRRHKARSTVISAGVEMPVEEKAFRQKKLKVLEKKTIKLIRSLDGVEKKVTKMQKKDFDSPWLS